MTATYNPHLYDLTTPDSFRGDVEFYLRKAKASGGPVLELGAGTGRITLAIARSGVTVHALDANPDMLEALNDKLATEPSDVHNRVVVVEGDMRTFKLPERFPLIICPYRAFLHNLTEADQLACLRQVRGHLAPGGCFAFNVYYPTLEFMSHHTGSLAGVWRWRATHPGADGGFVIRSEAIRYDPVPQQVHALIRYDEYGADGVLVRTYLHRLDLAYLYPGDIRRLLDQAGFANVELSGGPDGQPVESDVQELFVEAVSR